MGLIRNLATAFAAAAVWVTVTPFIVRSRMDGFVERNLAAYDELKQREAEERALGGPIPQGAAHH